MAARFNRNLFLEIIEQGSNFELETALQIAKRNGHIEAILAIERKMGKFYESLKYLWTRSKFSEVFSFSITN